MKSFSKWYEKSKATRDMEWAIIRDKLNEGINGIEWLVMQVELNDNYVERSAEWVNLVCDLENKNLEEVIKDALTLDFDTYQNKHELNWWISVKHSLTFLKLLKDHNYNNYSDLLKKLER